MSKTLGKHVTATFFGGNQDKYDALQKHWSELVKSGVKLTAAQHMVYAILRGKDWRKGFSPITNKNKLANGGLFNSGYSKAIYQLTSSFCASKVLEPFKDFVKPNVLEDIRKLIIAKDIDIDNAYSEAELENYAKFKEQTQQKVVEVAAST